MADEAVHFINHDSIKHTLHTYSLRGRKAKIMRTMHTQSLRAQGTDGKSLPRQKIRRAVAVGLTCDRHDFMENWLYVSRIPITPFQMN